MVDLYCCFSWEGRLTVISLFLIKSQKLKAICFSFSLKIGNFTVWVIVRKYKSDHWVKNWFNGTPELRVQSWASWTIKMKKHSIWSYNCLDICIFFQNCFLNSEWGALNTLLVWYCYLLVTNKLKTIKI